LFFFYCGAGAFSSGKAEVFRKNDLSPKITKDVTFKSFKSLEEEGKNKKPDICVFVTNCPTNPLSNPESDRTPNHFEKI
jgi:hypothetical protein